jgi:hypothetical protein
MMDAEEQTRCEVGSWTRRGLEGGHVQLNQSSVVFICA